MLGVVGVLLVFSAGCLFYHFLSRVIFSEASTQKCLEHVLRQQKAQMEALAHVRKDLSQLIRRCEGGSPLSTPRAGSSGKEEKREDEARPRSDTSVHRRATGEQGGDRPVVVMRTQEALVAPVPDHVSINNAKLFDCLGVIQHGPLELHLMQKKSALLRAMPPPDGADAAECNDPAGVATPAATAATATAATATATAAAANGGEVTGAEKTAGAPDGKKQMPAHLKDFWEKRYAVLEQGGCLLFFPSSDRLSLTECIGIIDITKCEVSASDSWLDWSSFKLRSYSKTSSVFLSAMSRTNSFTIAVAPTHSIEHLLLDPSMLRCRCSSRKSWLKAITAVADRQRAFAGTSTRHTDQIQTAKTPTQARFHSWNTAHKLKPLPQPPLAKPPPESFDISSDGVRIGDEQNRAPTPWEELTPPPPETPPPTPECSAPLLQTLRRGRSRSAASLMAIEPEVGEWFNSSQVPPAMQAAMDRLAMVSGYAHSQKAECQKLMCNLLHGIQGKMLQVLNSTGTGFVACVECKNHPVASIPANSRIPFTVNLEPVDGKITFAVNLSDDRADVILDVGEQVQLRRIPDERIEEIVMTLPQVPFMRVREQARENLLLSDMLIKYRTFVFFSNALGEVRVRSTRDEPDGEQSARIEKVKANINSLRSYQKFAKSAFNWGMMMLFPEEGGDASLINVLFAPKNGPDDPTGRLLWSN